MASKQNLDYVYEYLETPDFQKVVEDIVNQLVNFHNTENEEIVAWFLN